MNNVVWQRIIRSMKYFHRPSVFSVGKHVLSLPNYIGLKVKEFPDPDGQFTIRSLVSKVWSQLIA